MKNAILELTEYAWLWAIAFLLLVSIPLWFIPYTIYKIWKRK